MRQEISLATSGGSIGLLGFDYGSENSLLLKAITALKNNGFQRVK